MSVNNINSIYPTQGVQGATSYTMPTQDDEGGIDIGKWLLGGLGIAVTVGVGYAAYRTGTNANLTKDGDNMFQIMLNGIKKWFGKDAAEAANTIDNIPQEYRTTLKTFFSGGELSQAELDDLFNNREVLSDFITNTKVKNNTRKIDITQTLLNHLDGDNLKASDDTAKLLNQLLSKDGKEIFKFKDNGITLVENADEVLVAKAKKLGILNSDGALLIDKDVITDLQKKYTAKHDNYQNMASFKYVHDTGNLIGDLNSESPISYKNKNGEDIAVTASFKSLFSRYSDMADEKTLKAIKTADEFVLYTAKLKKYHNAGSLTKDEYENLMALAENKFMVSKPEDYLTYMTKGLKKKNGKDIALNNLDKDDVQILNNKFSWLELDEPTTTLNANTFIQKKKESTPSIATYLGLQGLQLPPEWTIENSNLVWKAKNGASVPKELYRVNIGNNCSKTIDGPKVTSIKISLEQLKNILNSTTAAST